MSTPPVVDRNSLLVRDNVGSLAMVEIMEPATDKKSDDKDNASKHKAQNNKEQ